MAHTELLAIVGSLRAGSVNGATARAAVASAPTDTNIAIHTVADLPLYNGDIEVGGAPESIEELHEAVRTADGLLLFSPEYNGSFPAVTKNVIDWLSRPPKSWEETALTLVATSPGPRAGLGLREHFSTIMARQPVRLFDTLGIGSYVDKLDETGELADVDTLAELADFVQRFAAFAGSGIKS